MSAGALVDLADTATRSGPSDTVWIAILGIVGTALTVLGAIAVALINRRLDIIGKDAAEARAGAAQLHRNGGSTLADSAARTEQAVADLRGEVAAISGQVQAVDSRTARIGDEVTQGRREALADRERMGVLEERVDAGLAEHATFRDQLARLLLRRRY